MSLGPNDLLPCGTDGARRRHLAHAELCVRCEPGVEWLGRCPHCWDRVVVVGGVVTAHDLEGVESFPCDGVGVAVPAPGRLPWRVAGVAA